MTAPLPTPGEVEEMRDRHVPYEPFGPEDTTQFCRAKGCGNLWPCDAARLLALVGNQAMTLDEDKLYIDDLDARLASVLAECDRTEDYEHRRSLTLSALVDRIRRAATGEAT